MFILLGLTASNEMSVRTLFETEEGQQLKQGDLQSLGFLLDQVSRNRALMVSLFRELDFRVLVFFRLSLPTLKLSRSCRRKIFRAFLRS